ncbi:MAG: hypothetical protein UU69_C0030G0004 [Candidatus Magasanikbacteria bacterium GW2011_GWA2_41_55]|uniref:Uncharacterized protein n=1 Tax=Candidatus Magasanikbacteria bacterium GW2011_GWA2_41_55 TaxID=1619038 RepID=A0A0G0WKK0_9BACT|nr:MAG: hypothetical protein UU69_C0030G0004 [Candidatus Magasanikbacteria bacterium GW2011_GWA2_41_55]
MKYFLFSILFSLSLFAAMPVWAIDPAVAPDIVGEITGQMDVAGATSGLSAQDPRLTVARFINVFLGILGTIFIAYIVYAGYLWMTAGGEEEKTTQAKTHIRNAVIGLVIILLAFSINILVSTYLIRATSNPYYQPPLSLPQVK